MPCQFRPRHWDGAGFSQRRAKLSYASSLAIVSLTQFAKYIPGNVANLLGRMEFARLWGVDVGVASISVTFEFLLVLGAGLALAGGGPFVVEGHGAAAAVLFGLEVFLPAPSRCSIPLSLLLVMTAAARRLFTFLQMLARPRNLVRLTGAMLTYVACYFASGAGLLALAVGPAHAAGADCLD